MQSLQIRSDFHDLQRERKRGVHLFVKKNSAGVKMVFFLLLFHKKNRNKHEDGESYCPNSLEEVQKSASKHNE
jgi:hypothetical protein